MNATLLAAIAVAAVCGIYAGEASAALPEIGRCVKVEATKEGNKKIYDGKYANRKCTVEGKAGKNKFEWIAGPGTEKEFESPGSLEPVTLETAAGTVIACENSKMFGEYTGAQTETDHIGLFGCKDTATQKPCQSLRPEETTAPLPEEGTVLSEEVEGKLGFIDSKVKGKMKPKVGWEYKGKDGPMFIFECGTPVETPETPELPEGTKLPEAPAGTPAAAPSTELPTELPTLVTIEGSFIGSVKPVDKMAEEFFFTYVGAKGKQTPSMFEGGEAAALTANIIVPGLPPEEKTETISYAGIEEESVVEDYEIKAIP